MGFPSSLVHPLLGQRGLNRQIIPGVGCRCSGYLGLTTDLEQSLEPVGSSRLFSWAATSTRKAQPYWQSHASG